jgi:hypothetical protein
VHRIGVCEIDARSPRPSSLKFANAPRLLERTHPSHNTVADDYFCWAGFLWLVNGPWLVVGTTIGAALPIPLVIVTIPFVLTWIGDRVFQAVRGEKIRLD